MKKLSLVLITLVFLSILIPITSADDGYTYITRKTELKNFINNFDGTPEELIDILEYACENVDTTRPIPEHPKSQFGYAYPTLSYFNAPRWWTYWYARRYGINPLDSTLKLTTCYYRETGRFSRTFTMWNAPTLVIDNGDGTYSYKSLMSTSRWAYFDRFDRYGSAYPVPIQ